MKAIILQSRAPNARAWSTVNRFVSQNHEAASSGGVDHALTIAELRTHALSCARRYGADMLPGYTFRVVELDHVHSTAPA